jgi:hypothetical protein
VEVVPTADHWEADYVAAGAFLARGWERQLDVADNPVFYTEGALNASSYRAWLYDNGVRFVALPGAPLDFAGVAEGRLVAGGLPYLRLAWHDAHWRVFAVAGSPGLVSGAGALASMQGRTVTLRFSRPGVLLLRVRYSSRWRVTARDAKVAEASGRWLQVRAPMAGTVTMRLSLLP